MTPEDRLRDLLRDGEPPVGPGSFDDVRARARRRARRGRALVAGGLALVVALAGAVAVPLLDDDEPPQQVIADPGPTTSTVPTTTVPVTEDPVGIWPFVTAAEADDKAIELPFNPTDAAEVATAFVAAFTAGTGAGTATETLEGRQATVSLRVRNHTTVVELRKLGTSDRWTVVGAEADGLVLDEAAVGADSVLVAGRATAFEGTVVVSVLDRGRPPALLGRAPLTGEQGEMKPFRGDVPFDPSPSGLGVVVAVTESAEDGAVEQVAAAPVRWAPGAPTRLADDELVAVLTTDIPDDPDTQDVVILDASSGEVRRTLVDDFGTAEGGVLDVAVSADRTRVFVALSTSACESDVQVISLDGSLHASVGSGERVAVSPDGRGLALWVREGCGEREFIEVRGQTFDDVVGRFDTVGTVGALAWDGNGAVLYESREEAEVGVRRVVLDTGSSALLRPTGSWVSWAHPVLTPRGVAVLATNEEAAAVQLVHAEEGGGVIHSIGPDAVSYAVVRGQLHWVTASGLLTTGEGVVKRDVALVAS